MVHIREYRDEDLPLLKELVFGLHEAVRPFDVYLPPAGAVIDAYFAYLVERVKESRGTFFIAEDDGKAAGYLCLFGLVPVPTPDQDPEKYALVSDVHVLPAHQGRGIGKVLMKKAEDYARRKGAGRIELSVLAGNRRAVDFYRSLGYRERIKVYAKSLEE